MSKEAVKAKTEITMRLHQDKLYSFCPYCGAELKQLWQPTQLYDDSNHVRHCGKCDTAWIWKWEHSL